MKHLALAVFIALAAMFAAGPAAAQADDARIHLIHGIPGVDVDVEVGGDAVIEDFSFQDTQDLSSFAGQTLAAVMVKVAGTDDVAIDVGDLALPASGNYTAIAHLDAEGTPTVSVFENDVSTLAAGEGRLVVRHAAAAPAVDVRAGGDVALANVVNGDEGSLDLPAGTVSASVVPAGSTEPVVIGPADLPVEEGVSLIVYAVGSLDDDTLTVTTESIEGLHGAPSRVDTGNSPVGQASGGVTTVTLVLTSAAAAAVVGGIGARRRARARARV